jgi:hypothetical protein
MTIPSFVFPVLLTVLAVTPKINPGPPGHYPDNVMRVLKESGKNRSQLEKAIDYFRKSADPQKLQAIYFLVANMDTHYSADYYWSDGKGRPIHFSELEYPDFPAAVKAFEEIKRRTPQLHPQAVQYRDIDTITAAFLIEDVEQAFAVRSGGSSANIPFHDFCEYILPYRVSVEPLQDWRAKYRQQFSWIRDSLKGRSAEDGYRCVANTIKKWFTNTYDIVERKEPLPRLGALQLLHRKKGPCEDIADLVSFALRSQGILTTNDMVTFWATSSGSHFFNTIWNDSMKPVRFDISSSNIRFTTFDREPAKVIRSTYTPQNATLAAILRKEEIPEGFLRSRDYIDVTQEYWPTSDVHCRLFPATAKPDIVYACVLNEGHWKPTWWGRVRGDSTVFTNLSRGAAFLPAVYRNGRIIPAGYVTLSGYNNSRVLVPDTIHRRTIVLEEQEKYLAFQPGKKYRLYYWNNSWRPVGQLTAQKNGKNLVFPHVPDNALLLLVPEYSQHKERPFVINGDGKRVWW